MALFVVIAVNVALETLVNAVNVALVTLFIAVAVNVAANVANVALFFTTVAVLLCYLNRNLLNRNYHYKIKNTKNIFLRF